MPSDEAPGGKFPRLTFTKDLGLVNDRHLMPSLQMPESVPRLFVNK